MIQGTLNGEVVKIPTSWEDVPYKNYIAFTKVDKPIEKASALLALPYTTLENISSEQLGAILMAMSFMVEEPSAYMAELNTIDIGRESYGKIETAKAIIGGSKFPIDAVLPVLKVYTGIDYADSATTIVHPLGAFFLLNCNGFLTDTKD